MSDEEYKKLLKQYHELSDRHILVVETDMPYPDVSEQSWLFLIESAKLATMLVQSDAQELRAAHAYQEISINY